MRSAGSGVLGGDLLATLSTQSSQISTCLCKAAAGWWQVGVQKARELSAHSQLPIVAVHHMEAHALMARAAAARCSGSETEDVRPEFPFLALLVSGGHNLLLVVRGVGDYQILGSTVDDAVGMARTHCWRGIYLASQAC